MPPRAAPRSLPAPPQCLYAQGKNTPSHRQDQTRQFSHSTPQSFHASCRHAARSRRNMFSWLNGPGRVFREPLPGSTNYLGAYDRSGNLRRLRSPGGEEDDGDNAGGDAEQTKKAAEEKKQRLQAEEEEGLDEFERQQRREEREAAEAEEEHSRSRLSKQLPKETGEDLRPFPLNRQFRSQSVLSEELREEIWKRVVERRQTVSAVSVDLGVDMRRVAAVVRLTQVEKDWANEGRRLAVPYASAILAMLPQTKFDASRKKNSPHESINDLPVHPSTLQQIFYPASESRQFTRADAAKVFSPTLLPADARIPHPELIQQERDRNEQIPRDERAVLEARAEKARRDKEDRLKRKQEWEAQNLQTVPGQRWDFKFENISVDDAGKDGRGKGGVGWRYGNPHRDRKRGQLKIPQSVE